MLALFTTLLNTPFEIDQGAAGAVDLRIAGGNRLHAGGRLAMTAGAGAPLFAGRLIPQRTAARNPQHTRIGKFITLQSAYFCTGKFNA